MEELLRRCFSRNPLFVSREIADEVILVPIRRSADDIDSIFALNEVGAFVWGQLDGVQPVTALRDAVVTEFDVTAAEAEADLIDFFQQLATINAVQEL